MGIEPSLILMILQFSIMNFIFFVSSYSEFISEYKKSKELLLLQYYMIFSTNHTFSCLNFPYNFNLV